MIPPVRRLLAAALFGALLVLPGFTGAAQADSSLQTVWLAKTAADVQKVANYWNPDKLKKADNYAPATPATKPATPTSTSTAAATAGPVTKVLKGRTAPRVTPVAPRKGGAASTIGKVFFRFGDKEYWCSASSVAAGNRSVVATAGHCAYDPRQGVTAQYWIFVPNPGPNGETPNGIYVGSSISMHLDWAGKGDYDFDYAFVTVHRGFTWTEKDGKYVMTDVGRLQDNVGGDGLAINQKIGGAALAFGYPAGPQPDGSRPYDGRTLELCKGLTSWTVAPGLDLQKGVQLQPCSFTAGASGGPWLVNYNAAQKLGDLTGINSLTWNRDAKGAYDAVSSPNFDSVTGEIYRHAAALTTPSKVT
ncbi:trypsin-like serine peptidase [Nonomuraea sediminis]|uniref:trypsin-like serine peptidase n=1 Tax=Nonomuraea sediminis TaxID=2835864 RepID=UPI001BDD0C0B|nr:hypothetical protein [Nonomuraea sediminis]